MMREKCCHFSHVSCDKINFHCLDLMSVTFRPGLGAESTTVKLTEDTSEVCLG